MDLFERFPDMTPVQRMPSLHTVNGIGTAAYGVRDFDPETSSYVKTVWLTILWIPIVALGSYRVADAQNGGWYLLGRVPVGILARLWSLLLVMLTCGGVGSVLWYQHTQTPGYKAGQMLAQGRTLHQQGKFIEAASQYRLAVESQTDRAAEGKQALLALLGSEDVVTSTNALEVAGAFRIASQMGTMLADIEEIFNRGKKLAEGAIEDRPEVALEVSNAIRLLAPQPDALQAVEQQALEVLAKRRPDDVEILSRLAAVYDQGNQRARCRALLEPHRAKLGTSEGARVLGLIYFEEGKIEDAYSLLQPYTETRLTTLQETQDAFRSAAQSAETAAIEELKSGMAPNFKYDQYKKAPKNEQDEMVQSYLIGRMRTSAQLTSKREDLIRAATVVPVALDLGVLQLNRAQGMADPEARKKELERAEKTFLAVQGIAGERTEFRLSLAQVYYWLGKQAEGHKLFEEVLKAENRTPRILLLVSRVVRILGLQDRSRTLTEEAFRTPEATVQERQEAALLRALTRKDVDDEIEWLEKANPSDSQVKASLAEARGHKAERDGKEEEAARHFRDSIAVYAALPESSTTLNNGSIAHFALFGVTGDRSVLARAVQMQEKAVTFQQGDGILVGNVAVTVLQASFAEIVGNQIDIGQLRRHPNLDDLHYLYRDQASKDVLRAKLKASQTFARARAQFDRALILAPSNLGLYKTLQSVGDFLDEDALLTSLERRLSEVQPDLTQSKSDFEDFIKGKRDDLLKRQSASALPILQKRLEAARGTPSATFAVLAGQWVQMNLTLSLLGEKVNLDEVIRVAEEANTRTPSKGTEGILEAALLARATQRLTAGTPAFATMYKECQRTLGPTYLVAVALWHDSPTRAAVLADPDVRRVLEMIRDHVRRFSDPPSILNWAMLQHTHPEEAKQIAKGLVSSPRTPQDLHMEELTGPTHLVHAFRRCWFLDASGKHAEAIAALRKYAGTTRLPINPR